MPLRLSSTEPKFSENFDSYLKRRRDITNDVADIVANIIADVRARGDLAVAEYTLRLSLIHI